MTSRLFSSLDFGGLELANRIVIAPMCQYQAEDGCATHWHGVHLGNLALSGAGLLIVEATAVVPEGRISPGDLALSTDAHEQALARTVEIVRAVSPMPLGIQLAHAGRKASCAVPWEGRGQLLPDAGGWQTVAPSAVPFDPADRAPQALDQAGIDGVVQAFVDAARRSVRIGFDLIEIHAAHGYLLHSFLSPLSNQRTDRYGGSLENRMRLLLQVFDAVRAAVDVPVGVRISATDWVDGGWDVEQSAVLAQALDARGCTYLHCSSGGLSPDQQIPVGPGYQVPLARHITERVQMPVIAVGLITEPQQAEDILQAGDADAVALARGVLWNPRWPWHAAAELGATVWGPPSYLRGAPHGLSGVFETP